MQTRSLVLIALFTAIIVVLGVVPPIPLAFVPVPITAQFMGVLLVAIVLGARGGTLSVLLLLVLVAIGLPVLAGGRGGLAVFVGPTAGYLVGFVPSATVTGLISDRTARHKTDGVKLFAGFLFAAIAGVFVEHLCGIAWLSTYVGLSPYKALIGDLAFLPGDIIKAVVAAYLGRVITTNMGDRARLKLN